MLETALELSRQGFHVFPVKANSKFPAIKGWPKLATTDEETIRRWWSGVHHDRNVGIATGPSGLVVVDIDTKGGKKGVENFEFLLENNSDEWPETKTVETPSGGMHLYFWAPEGKPMRSTVSGIAEGVDTRAQRGYVVAEDSTLAIGKYERQFEFDIKPLPEWLHPLLKDDRGPISKVLAEDLTLDLPIDIEQAQNYLVQEKPAIQGEGGDAHTYNVCCQLHDYGMSPTKALELLTEFEYPTTYLTPDRRDVTLSATWNDRCKPPWHPNELTTKMYNAYDFAQKAPGCDSLDVSALKSVEKTVRVVSEMPDQIPKRDWLIEGRLISKYVTVTVAPGGIGKSMFTMLEAFAVATGLPLTGRKPLKQGAVLIYNTEDPEEEIQRRIMAIAMEHGLSLKDLDNIFYVSGVESPLRFVTTEGGRPVITQDKQKLQEIIEDNSIILTIIDPFIRSHGVDENSNGDIDLVVQQMSALAVQTNSAISVVHHSKKLNAATAKSGDMDISRGASSLVSAARIVSTVFSMTAEEAETMDILPEDRHWYMRVDAAKGNMSEPISEPTWFAKKSVTITNGDSVGTLQLYQPGGGKAAITVSSVEADNALCIIAPHLGIGKTPTDEVVAELAGLLPAMFTGTLAEQKKKYLFLFNTWVSNDTYELIAVETTTHVKGTNLWT